VPSSRKEGRELALNCSRFILQLLFLRAVGVSVPIWAQIQVQCASFLFSMRSNLSVLAAGLGLPEIYLVYVRLRYAPRIAGANSAVQVSTSLRSVEVNAKLNSR